ncbi:MAG: hypothetical protein IJ039_00445 [Clostridia bacterium]|nr:hypothetical protein [Clostridia bacterium]
MKALISSEIANEFELKTGIKVIPLPSYYKLDTPVSSHADMLFCILDNTIFCYEDYVKCNHIFDILKDLDYNVCFVSAACKKEYPYDVSLNALVMGKTIFCNKKYVAKEILEYADAHGYMVQNVKQGYSACSTLVLDENDAITSDASVFNAMRKIGKNVLLIDNSNIELKGYNCGFIGGATGVCGNKIYIFGELNKLVDYKKIKSLISSLNFNVVQISLGGVFDFGGIKLI